MTQEPRLTHDGEILRARQRRLRLPGLGAPLLIRAPASVDAILDRLDPAAPGAEDRIPYWAELWPSADALARFLLAGGGPRRPGAALEIGCGLGLVGLVALRLGWDLSLSDKDPEACAWAARNLRLNGFDERRVFHLDWRDPPPDRYDAILASDVLYERESAEPLARFLDAALAPRAWALIAEPGRPISEPALDLLALRFACRLLPARARVAGRWRLLRLLELRRRRDAGH
jgi:predicted nicotinamide N-methyase